MEPSWQETQDALAEVAKEAPAGTWIFGEVGGSVLGEPAVNRFALDRVAPDHPVYLKTYSGHGDIVNTKALHALEVAEEEPDPMGGRFERIPGSKRISGRIFEYAQWILDGTPVERGGALRGTYTDCPGWSGRLNFAETEITFMTQESLQWKDQLLLHCSGDKPIEVVFDASLNHPARRLLWSV
jgi:predicted amidohydrolase YtcJ